MPNKQEDSVLDKKSFTAKNIWGMILFFVLGSWAVASAFGALTHREERNEAMIKLESLRNDAQDKEIKAGKITAKENKSELEGEIKRTAYNNSQLTYRLNSAQQKQIDTLLLSDAEHKIRYEFIRELLREIKAGQK